jgi:BlaI family transcriptional regulator, penicillinase repressor
VSKTVPLTISDAEVVVMEVLWHTTPPEALSTDDIASALSNTQAWQLATVKTLLNRLLNKGAIRAQLDGRRYLYRPVLKREAWLRTQSLSLVDKLFDGRLAPLVAHFAAHRKLKAADIASLKKIIQDLESS